MTAGDSALLLTVSGFFNDPDGDTLTYTANSSNDSVATVRSTSGSRVAINAVAVGSATITVTASDGSRFNSNCRLTVSGFFNDRMVIRYCEAVGSAANRPAPDGDTLTYSANSSNNSMATNRFNSHHHASWSRDCNDHGYRKWKFNSNADYFSYCGSITANLHRLSLLL